MKLYPFQEQAINYHLEHHYSLDGSEMGLGKTLIALEAARRVGMSPAVFGPAFLAATWRYESERLGVKVGYFPYSTLHKVTHADLKPYRFWIAEECHFLKNPSAKRTHAFYTLLKHAPPEYFIGLSGTPIKNRIPDMWTLFAFCGVNPRTTSGKLLEGNLRAYHAFARHFCIVDEVNIAGRRIPRYRGIRADRVEEFKALLTDKFIRFKVEDVLQDLPSLTRKEVFVEIQVPPVEEAALRKAFMDYAAGHKADVTAKVRSAVLKAPATIEYCAELLESGEKLLIYSDHVEPAKAIAKAFKGSGLITGATSTEQKQAEASKFQAGETPVLVATIGAFSVGVTLTAARHVVFNDLSWVPANNLQAEKRIHRIGQRSACWAHFISATPTDVMIKNTLMEKLETIARVI